MEVWHTRAENRQPPATLTAAPAIGRDVARYVSTPDAEKPAQRNGCVVLRNVSGREAA
jgi:hypothetical protein